MTFSRVGKSNAPVQNGIDGSSWKPAEWVRRLSTLIGPDSGYICFTANHGRCFSTGSSSRRRPSSRSCITATLVKSLEIEQML